MWSGDNWMWSFLAGVVVGTFLTSFGITVLVILGG